MFSKFLAIVYAFLHFTMILTGLPGYSCDKVWLSPSLIISRISAEFESGHEITMILRRAYVQENGPQGELYGDCIFVFNQLPEHPFGLYRYEHVIPFQVYKPLRLRAGDINGDGMPELSIMVYKTTPLDPVMAKRPFFYNYSDGAIYPLWRGSRLSRPFEDYDLWDSGNGGAFYLLSTEYLSDGRMVLALYEWDDFGFVRISQSKPYISLRLLPQTVPGIITALDSKDTPLSFYYENNEIKESVN